MIKLIFEVDGEAGIPQNYDDNNEGAKALGLVIFQALKTHKAYIMITPNDLEDLEDIDE